MVKQIDFLSKINSILKSRGWVSVKSVFSGIYVKNRTFLSIKIPDECRTLFDNNEDAVECDKTECGEVFNTLPAYSWTIERDKFVLCFGKLPRYVFKINNSNYENSKKHIDTMLNAAEHYAAISDSELPLARAHYYELPSSESVFVLEQCSNELRNEFLIKMKSQNSFYLVKALSADIYQLVVVLADDSNNLLVSKDAKVINLKKDQLLEILNKDGIQCFERNEIVRKILVPKWELAAAQASCTDVVPFNKERFNQFNLSEAQLSIIALAWKKRLPITHLLNNKYSPDTMKELVSMLEAELDISDIKDNFSKESIQALHKIAAEHLSLRKYAVSGYTAQRIKSLYDNFLNAFHTQEDSLKQQGYSEQQIAFIKEIASAGKGTAKAKEKIPVLASRMKMLTETNYFADVFKFMIPSVADSDLACRVPWKSIPSQLKDSLYFSFKTFPDFSIKGTTWYALIDLCFSKADFLLYRHPQGLMIGFSHLYLTIQDNFVAIRDSAFYNLLIAEFINDFVFVNDGIPEKVFDAI